MTHDFIIKALANNQFEKYRKLNSEQLVSHHANWLVADTNPGFPCRVSLKDAKIGERVLVLPYIHHDVNSAYRASGPIFVREQAQTANLAVNEIPDILHHRQLSLRAYNSAHNMIDARVTPGTELTKVLDHLLDNIAISYIHIHNAGPGCFNCAVFRVVSNVQ